MYRSIIIFSDTLVKWISGANQALLSDYLVSAVIIVCVEIKGET